MTCPTCLAIALLTQTQTAFPPDNQYGANVWSAKLRAATMSAANYDITVPPTSDRSKTAGAAGQYSASGTDVKLQIRFFKVMSVSPAEASMRLKVWVRMSWVDERLAWNASEYGGINQTYYRADQSLASEASELWLPDIQPYNAIQGFVHTLEPSPARVTSDGAVFWSRPGSMEVLCKYSGLVAFPNDRLICKIEVAGWVLSGGQQGIELMGGGYEFSSQEVTSGSSYQELRIESVKADLKMYTYESFPSDPFPIVIYTIRMERSSMAYFGIVIFPGIVITLLSFLVFLTDTSAADALGYGIGVIVVNLFSNFILIGMLPICGETLWVDLFSMVNLSFCCISLFQSSFNIFLENMEEDHLLPLWLHVPLAKTWTWVARKFESRHPPERDPEEPPRSPAVHSEDSGEANDRQRLDAAQVLDESVAGVLYRRRFGSSDEATTTTEQTLGKAQEGQRGPTDAEVARRLILYESMFYELDANKNLLVNLRECDMLLSYLAIHLDQAKRKEIFHTYDHVYNGVHRGLSRHEFVTMCNDVLQHVPEELFEPALKNVKYAENARTVRNVAYWQEVAKATDRWACFIIPVLYILALIILFNIDLTDDHASESKSAEEARFSGIGPASFTTTGIVSVVLYCIAIAIISFAWVQLTRGAAHLRDEQQDNLKVTGHKLEQHRASARRGGGSLRYRPSKTRAVEPVVEPVQEDGSVE